MNLKRSLEAFIERVDPGITLGGSKTFDPSVREVYVASLDKARRLSTVWCVLAIILTVGLAISSVILQGFGKVASLSAASGGCVALWRMLRQKFAMDLLVAMLKAASHDPKELRQIATIFRSKL